MIFFILRILPEPIKRKGHTNFLSRRIPPFSGFRAGKDWVFEDLEGLIALQYAKHRVKCKEEGATLQPL